jgi:hypothetical protein
MRKRLLFLIIILFHICIAIAWSQESASRSPRTRGAHSRGAPVFRLNDDASEAPSSSEYIREWLILGPFLSGDLWTDFLAHTGGEANIKSNEGDTVTTADGKVLSWNRHSSRVPVIDLISAIGDYTPAIGYAYCTLQCKTAVDVRIHFSGVAGIAVWVNGKRMYSGRGFALDSSTFEAELSAGINHLLVKAARFWESWDFGVRVTALKPDRAVISGMITDETGHPLPNAVVRLRQDGKGVAWAQSDASGKYQIDVYPVIGSYDLFAKKGERGTQRLGMSLRESERRTLNLTLKQAVSIEGTLLMLDNETPIMLSL